MYHIGPPLGGGIGSIPPNVKSILPHYLKKTSKVREGQNFIKAKVRTIYTNVVGTKFYGILLCIENPGGSSVIKYSTSLQRASSKYSLRFPE